MCGKNHETKIYHDKKHINTFFILITYTYIYRHIAKMVQSKLHQNIQYVESHALDEGDLGHESAQYEFDLFPGKVYVIAIGKQRDDYSHYNVFYFPIYLIGPGDRIKAKIGVFEVDAKKVLNVFDDDDDLDLDRLEDPLLFQNITEEFVEKYGLSVEKHDSDSEDETKVESENSPDDNQSGDKDKAEEKAEDEDEDATMFSLQKDSDSKASTKPNKEHDSETKNYLTRDDIFIKEDSLPSQITYPAETEEDAKKFVSEYKETQSTTDNWIQQFMKNKQYEILRNEGGGDCFFATIRDAYSQIGYNTTVDKLRKFLSQEATQDLMEQYEILYKNYIKEIEYLESQMAKSKTMMNGLKKQSKKASSKEGQQEIVNEAKNLQNEYEDFKTKITTTKDLLQEVQFMKSIETLDQFKQYIQTSEFWADTWVISTLERLLNIKVIVLEKSEDVNASLLCGQKNDTDDMYANYDPQYYMIVSKTDEHYELVAYRKKKMMIFPEVPYAIKFKIVEKCMEKNAGIYATLPAFKQFQMDMGRQPISAAKEDAPMPQEEEGLYNKEVVFQFYERSSNKKPGRGSGEQITTQKEKGKKLKVSERDMDFSKLAKIEDWRQKLSDTWTKASFTVDQHKWSSVSHYLMALPFAQDYPDIFKEFSLDSNSVLSKDLEKAEESIQKKKKNEVGKHYEVYQSLSEIPDDVKREERKKALRAKFMSGDMTTLLHETKDAKLVLYKHRQEPEVDVDLMMLRKEIQAL